jgi:uncharacterized protein YbdZ (MbtH family)
MTSPFEDDQASRLVLINGEGQYSRCPEFSEAPTDMRSKSLIEAMDGFAR